jgi:hypothetical protein
VYVSSLRPLESLLRNQDQVAYWYADVQIEGRINYGLVSSNVLVITGKGELRIPLRLNAANGWNFSVFEFIECVDSYRDSGLFPKDTCDRFSERGSVADYEWSRRGSYCKVEMIFRQESLLSFRCTSYNRVKTVS